MGIGVQALPVRHMKTLRIEEGSRCGCVDIGGGAGREGLVPPRPAGEQGLRWGKEREARVGWDFDPGYRVDSHP